VGYAFKGFHGVMSEEPDQRTVFDEAWQMRAHVPRFKPWAFLSWRSVALSSSESCSAMNQMSRAVGRSAQRLSRHALRIADGRYP
jgi:hypothetical protein